MNDIQYCVDSGKKCNILTRQYEREGITEIAMWCTNCDFHENTITGKDGFVKFL